MTANRSAALRGVVRTANAITDVTMCEGNMKPAAWLFVLASLVVLEAHVARRADRDDKGGKVRAEEHGAGAMPARGQAIQDHILFLEYPLGIRLR